MALQLVPASPEVQNTYHEALLDFMGPHDPEVSLVHLPVGTLGQEDLQSGATWTRCWLPAAAFSHCGPTAR